MVIFGNFFVIINISFYIFFSIFPRNLYKIKRYNLFRINLIDRLNSNITNKKLIVTNFSNSKSNSIKTIFFFLDRTVLKL